MATVYVDFYVSDVWTCPFGVTTISVECWGGGGGNPFGGIGAGDGTAGGDGAVFITYDQGPTAYFVIAE